MAGQYFAVDPAAFVRTSDLTRQAFSGTWTADNNIRVTWSPTVKQKISGWYTYQRKDDAHWLQQILFMSPEAAQLVQWPTHLSTHHVDLHRHEPCADRSGDGARQEP